MARSTSVASESTRGATPSMSSRRTAACSRMPARPRRRGLFADGCGLSVGLPLRIASRAASVAAACSPTLRTASWAAIGLVTDGIHGLVGGGGLLAGGMRGACALAAACSRAARVPVRSGDLLANGLHGLLGGGGLLAGGGGLLAGAERLVLGLGDLRGPTSSSAPRRATPARSSSRSARVAEAVSCAALAAVAAASRRSRTPRTSASTAAAPRSTSAIRSAASRAARCASRASVRTSAASARAAAASARASSARWTEFSDSTASASRRCCSAVSAGGRPRSRPAPP